LTLPTVYAYALQVQPALLPSPGTLPHVHAHVNYPSVIAQIPTTLIMTAVHVYVQIQAQPALLPASGIMACVYVPVLHHSLIATIPGLAAVNAYAQLQSKPALLHISGIIILIHVHASVLYGLLVARIPSTLTMKAAHAYAHLQAQSA